MGDHRLLDYPAKYARALDAIENAWNRKTSRVTQSVLDAGRSVRILRNGIEGDDLRDETDELAFAELDWAMLLFDHAADPHRGSLEHPARLGPPHDASARNRAAGGGLGDQAPSSGV
ncbi:hypothetical protein [Streptomyces sp. SID3343]|uniref:hypothetical protein n=1 Tax=Streptomyces sp. SID3343 TaxID=2690260 RepID=UPI00136868FD|nr:hypothetical protein [Streptomyces sp. SID3343]MYW00650.1 hypothetical protein [Streptomyces sp. SID3343]